jgi:hypothetical protein
VADAHPVGASYQGGAQEAWLGKRTREQALGRVPADVQTEGAEARMLAIDERRRAQTLLEAAQLSTGGRTLGQVHEVDRDPPLSEKAQRLAGVLTVRKAEDYWSGSRGLL